MQNGLSRFNPTRLRNVAFALAMLALALPSAAFAQTTPTLPDIGVDPAAYITTGGTKLGLVIAAAFGLAIIVMVVSAAIMWFSRAKGKR